MFGHKGAHAWDAIMSGLFDAGFTPVASWPIHTERKAKLRHGHIAALSSSCLIVCEPVTREPSLSITWKQFRTKLQAALGSVLPACKENHFYGADLVAATMAPALTLFKGYKQIMDGPTCLTTEEFLDRLPRIIAENELETILQHNCLEPYSDARKW